ncbi:MAG: flagellar basal-body rod protein FlgG [Planctomycetes bacterium]|nr:flagellar basal-body rod protein FlgG [Planctomycetota bacterium]
MTLRALSIAATGGRALMNKIDTISNNLANVNTTAFKKARANFADLFYQQIQRAGFGEAEKNQHPTGLSFGMGVRLASTEKLFEQGSLENTGRNLDVAIDGEGFLAISLPDSTVAYTRAGSLHVDSQGNLVTPQGFLLNPQITVPTNITSILIDTTGLIQGVDPTQPAVLQPVGQFQLTRFINASGLEAIGDNLYRETPASGQPQTGAPTQGGLGFMRQGFLEESNVDVIKEMVDLIQTQRAFEINGNSIKAADEMLQNVNGLRR